MAWDELLEDEPGTIDPNAGWQLRFKDQLPDRLMGEYTIVFTGYDESGAAEEVYWSFILWKPIEEK